MRLGLKNRRSRRFHARRFKVGRGIQPLEARQLLAGDLILSEFMADNTGSLLDGDGVASDWIEIHNAGDALDDLAGWYLTDDPNNLTQWQFPADRSDLTQLDADERIVLFASGQAVDDYVDSIPRLHTNFELHNGGEFLALVRDDGVTIAAQYAPEYPAQFDDVSYGFDGQTTIDIPLVVEGDTARVFVPTDDSQGNAWLGGDEPFDDSDQTGWFETATPIDALKLGSPGGAASTSISEGFDPGNGTWNSITATAVASVDTGYAWSGYQTSWGLALLDSVWEGQVLDMSGVDVGYDNWNAWTVFGGDSVTNLQTVSFSWGAIGTSGNLNAEALIQDANGDWFVSDDVVADTAGSTFSIDATTTTWRTSSAPVIGTPLTIGGAGTPDLSQVQGGGIHTVGLAAGGQTRLDTLTFTGMTAAATEFSSAFIRMPFDVVNAADWTGLVLDTKYDDGFVAYLNGTEVARDNFTGVPAWDSLADASRADELIAVPVALDLSDYLHLLEPNATNILAIQGLNSAVTDDDFLIVPELTATMPKDVYAYFTTPTPGAENAAGVDYPPLTDGLIISEFMADNTGSLLDGDGVASDWIEIHNTGDSLDDLAGWYLTDDPDNLTRWQFPADRSDLTQLEADERIVLFASGQAVDDYVDSIPRLHTNFKLDNDGEFLALVRDNGVTIASQYAPEYPVQFDDVSYGLDGQATIDIPLVVEGDTARVFVPTDDSQGSAWTGAGDMFDDSDAAGWFGMDTPVDALKLGPAGGAALTSVSEGFNPGGGQYLYFDGVYGGAQTSIDTGYSWSGYRSGGWGMALWDNAGEGRLDMSGANSSYNDWNAWTTFGVDSVANLESISFTWTADSASGNLNAEALIQDANGDWFVSDDAVVDTVGSTFSIDATTTTWRTSSAPVIGTPLTIGGAGTPDLSQVQGGGIHTVGLAAGGQTRLDTLTFTGMTAAATEFSSAFIRMPFDVVNAADWTGLVLDTKYDDGFVAYLNGTEVARDNFTGVPAWDSLADASRADELIAVPVALDLSDYLHLLEPNATNILAIQGLNSAVTDDDFLIVPELTATMPKDVYAYFTTPTPGAVNTPGVVYPQVVINEVHYNPVGSGDASEFVELYNPSDRDIDISGWYFSDGFDFTFAPDTILPAGEYVVVAKDTAAFAAEFGIRADAQWEVGDRLNNQGETIVLRDATGGRVDEVDYKLGFPWPTVGGDVGPSIELVHPSLNNSLGGNWRPSQGTTGTPDVTYLDDGGQWQYFKGTQEPSTEQGRWRDPDFVTDADWSTGSAPIGYGETFIAENLADMQGGYTTVYLRKEFNVSNPGEVASLRLDAMIDDGINVWINGAHVRGVNVPGQELTYDATSTTTGPEIHSFQEFTLPDPSGYLVAGTNVVAVQLVNASLGGSSDAFFDGRLVAPGFHPEDATPGVENTATAADAPPAVRKVKHLPKAPTSGQEVTITAKVTDLDGVADVTLEYQLVDPGSYIGLDDAAYQTDWTAVPMTDDGTGGDAVAGDDVYTVVLPAALQLHRRLVRYRIKAVDTFDISVTAPMPDDPQPNFAYFVYDGIPEWTGADQPGVTAPVTYGADVMTSLPTYHLISNESDVLNSQYNQAYEFGEYRFSGTFVSGETVYDHVFYKIRGGFSTYWTGKNKWKFRFSRGHEFQGFDQFGNPWPEKLTTLNVSAAASPWVPLNRGMAGLDEALSFTLMNQVGVPAPNIAPFQFRVVDSALEADPTNQYEGDLWGLYLGFENPSGDFLDAHDLPDGNLFRRNQAETAILKHQGEGLPGDLSDLQAFIGTGADGYNKTDPIQPVQWWRENVDLDGYYTYRTIADSVNHSDRSDYSNMLFFFDPETEKWSMLPWDMDLLYLPFEPTDVNREQFRKALEHPELEIEFANRARELQDLLLNEDQVWQMVDQYADYVEPFAAVDRAMWDYNPYTAANPYNPYVNLAGSFNRIDEFAFVVNGVPGTTRPALSCPEGETGCSEYDMLANWVKTFIVPGGDGGDDVAAQHADANIPDTPTINDAGDPTFPQNGITLGVSAFSDPDGVGTFAAVQWRIGEVTDPTAPTYDPIAPVIYEIDAVWESGELVAFENTIEVPGHGLQVGHAYRARVRMKDDTGRWSHWSDELQFVVTDPVDSDVSQHLRISEIMYNPAAPAATGPEAGFADNDDFEFIELINTSDSVDLDISGVSFSDGIQFTFPAGTSLPPGERILAVRNQDAFEARYGTGMNVADEYKEPGGGNKLDNGGETLRLDDGAGGVIQNFAYNDGGKKGWPAAADGQGSSLEAVSFDNGTADPATWNDYGDSAFWYAGSQVNGSPGTAATPTVLERHIFYGGSALDDGANGAIATDKTALLPGTTTVTATAANFSNYENGINRLLIDVLPLTAPTSIDAIDFTFHIGNDDNPSAWPAAPTPGIAVLEGQGRGGADRIVLTWPDGAIVNQWLQVTALSNANGGSLGLSANDVFYYGSAPGEVTSALGAGLPALDAGLLTPPLVNAADVIAIRDNPRGPGNPAGIDDSHDINRDGFVNATDMILARNNATSPLSALRLIELAQPAAPAPMGEGESMFATGRLDSATAPSVTSLDGLMAAQANQPDVNCIATTTSFKKRQLHLSSWRA